MDGPGEYLPDVTEGITRVEDLLEVTGIGQAIFEGIIDLVEIR